MATAPSSDPTSASASARPREDLDALREEIRSFIGRCADGSSHDAERDALLRRLLPLQRNRVAPYQRFLRDELDPDPLRWPALPTDVFRYARVSGHPASQDVATFRTSGTTSQAYGIHSFRDLSLYDLAARSGAAYALFGPWAGGGPRTIVSLCASPEQKPDSSLCYMVGQFSRWFGKGEAKLVCSKSNPDAIDYRLLRDTLHQLQEPTALVGTTFHFLFAAEALGPESFSLPKGSWLMHTGGFKNRTAAVSNDAFLQAMAERFSLSRRDVVCEYGMTELSSQLYTMTLRRGEVCSHYWVPGWVRASVIDAASGRTVPTGTAGLLRLDDLANVDSVAAVQTSDRACLHGDGGIELLGRAADAVPRGCSLAVDED